ncbi:MAG TPA: hypothetical protein VN635_03615 [Conexibacter sp.]|nr:hypothetical protein [Conexibacter sp.]
MSDREQAPGALPPEPNASGEPHDVLAAEQFAMPAPQAAWHPGPVELPPEPNASGEPHDVLAAEAFAMPAPPPHVEFASAPAAAGRPSPRRVLAAAAGLGTALAALLHRRRRDRRG